MSTVFLRVCNLALVAAWVALAVMLARLLLRKAPRWISCLLWSVVALRLMLPFSFESMFSLIPSAQPLPENIAMVPQPVISSGIAAVDNVVNPVISATLTPAVGDSINPMQLLLEIGAWVWLVGVGGMLVYALISYLRLTRSVRASIRENGVLRCDDITSPFILGVIRPRIYLPSTLDEQTAAYVIAHERAHLRRWDHIWKPLGFALLSVYWFQPLLWVAYVLLCRDIEAACDERVIREMDGGDKKRYSEALLSCSVRSRALSACPLAFGEVGVKSRIRAVLNYRRPAFWVILIAVLLSVLLAVGLLSDPWQTPGDLLQPGTSWADEDGVLELTVQENFEILGTMSFDDVQMDVRMMYREQYAEICAIDDVYGDAPLLKCGLRARRGKLVLLVKEDTVQTGIEQLTLKRRTGDAVTVAPNAVHTEYEGIYLTIDTIQYNQDGSLTLYASWHNESEAQAIYGEPYAIDYWDGAAWVDLTPENLGFELPGYLLSPGEVKQKEYSTARFGLPSAGRYRLRSHFSIEDLPYKEWVETQNNYETWMEFTVTKLSDPTQADVEAQLSYVQSAYPEYFGLDTTDGLTVYVWQMAAGSYSCGLLPGQPNDHEQMQLLQLKGTSIEQMKTILNDYALPEDQITVEPTYMLYSSYLHTFSEAEIWSIKAMLGIDGYTPRIDAAVCDIDRDGKQEHVIISTGPTFGRFSFRLSVYDVDSGQSKYNGVFYSPVMQLRLEIGTDGNLYLCGTEQLSGVEHRYDVTMKDGVVSITEDGVPIGEEMDPDSVPGSADAEKGKNRVVPPTAIAFPLSDETHRYLEPQIILTYAVENDSPWGRYIYHRVFKKCYDCGEVIEAVEPYLCQYNNELCQGGCLSGR
ncbi:MAG: M56 family metallopeptidase [Clostridia bacterium]|nr:M56 family metallopeptidase [Clostridia bacterium]